LLTELTYWFARFTIFEIADVETPSCLATSAKATPLVLTNPIAIRARTLLACLRRLLPFISSMGTFSFLHIFEENAPSSDDVGCNRLHIRPAAGA
jgi:hypothetical protein